MCVLSQIPLESNAKAVSGVEDSSLLKGMSILIIIMMQHYSSLDGLLGQHYRNCDDHKMSDYTNPVK